MVLLVGFFAGCSHTDVHGVVLNGFGDAPLAGASVTLAGAAATATTDAEGRFVLPDPAPGVQHLQVSALGFLPPVPVSVVLAEGHQVEAEALRAFPVFDGRAGLWDGTRYEAPVELAAEDWRFPSAIGVLYGVAPTKLANVPAALPGVSLLVRTPDANPATTWELRPLELVKAHVEVREYGFFKQQYPIPDLYEGDADSESRTLTGEPVSEGVLRFAIPDVSPGVWLLSAVPSSAGGLGADAARDQGFALRISDRAPELVREGGLGLKLAVGQYAADSAAFGAAWAMVREACPTNPSCGPAAAVLANAPPRDLCAGNLTVRDGSAVLLTSPCPDQAYFVKFVASGPIYRLDSVAAAEAEDGD